MARDTSDLLNVITGLEERLRALGYSADVGAEDVLADPDDYPDADTDADVSYALGLIHGYAMALNVTPLALIDEVLA